MDWYKIGIGVIVLFLMVRCAAEDAEKERKCFSACESTKYTCGQDGLSTPAQCDTAYQLCRLNCRPRGK